MQQMSSSSPNTYPSNPVAMNYFPTQLPSNIVERYMKKQSLIFGIAQVMIGSLCICFNAISLGMSTFVGLGSVGHGFWCGVLYIVTGTLGMRASQLSTKCNIVAFMVLCILSACSTIALMIFGIIGAASTPVLCNFDNIFRYQYYYNSYYRTTSTALPCREMPTYQTIMAMQALLAISGLIEIIIAVCGAVICCKSGVCGCCNQVPMVAMPAVSYPPNNGQMLSVSQGGQYAYSTNPTMYYSHGPSPAYVTSGWTSNQPQMQPTTAGGPNFGQPPPGYFAPSDINQSTDKTTMEICDPVHERMSYSSAVLDINSPKISLHN